MPNASIPAIQQFQMPDPANTAAKFLQLKALRQQGQNEAVLGQQKFQAEQASTKRKNSLEVNDFALNLLAGVNSAEDLEIAKGQFNARYPQFTDMTEKIMSDYTPQKVDMIRNSLRTETQRMKLEEREEEIKGFGAGSALYKGGKALGQVPFAPTKPPAPKFEVFQGPEGDQAYIEKGGEIEPGYTKVQPRGTRITVNTGDLGKTTKAGLEQDIIMGIQNIQSFKETRKLFKPEYLTMFGKGQKLLAEAADKAGISTKEQKRLIRERSKWFRQAKADFIAYRKWATGVAGGEKELKEIATAYADPVKNSPTQYLANLDGIEETTKRVLMTNVAFLRSGITIDQPLEKVLEQARKIGIPSPPGIPTSTPGGGMSEKRAGKTRIITFDKQGNRIGERWE